MGKRKSKTSKKKHAKAVAATSTSARNSLKHRTTLSSSKSFGVPVTRNGKSPSEPKRRATPAGGGGTAGVGRRRRRDGTVPRPVVRNDRERREFEEESAAVLERERYSNGGGVSSGKGKGKGKERGLAFAPPKLAYGGDGRVRSMEDMVVEATSRLSSGSIDIGVGGPLQPQQQPSGGVGFEQQEQQPSNLLQLMAKKIRRDERVRKLAETMTGKEEVGQNTTNRYWALEEEEEEEKEFDRTGPQFAFAPASFSLPSSAAMLGGVEEDDPDL